MKLRTVLALTATAGAATLVGTATAHAATPVTLGGGSGIILSNHSVCSLTTIGHDNAGRLVGLTAGHCGPAGTLVSAEKDRFAGPVGTITAADDGLDYAVIEFEPDKVVPVRTIGATTIAGTAPVPGPGAQICSDGRTTGFNCSVNWGPLEDIDLGQTCSNHGDSGGPITSGDRLVGMLQGGLIGYGALTLDIPCVTAAFPIHSPTYYRPIDQILSSIDATGGPGTGYQPI
ncbi:S1 family peptidase [Nocardia sp. NPDC088792]|uniref:S1 family peptidase n=1 Tax=Nocardia sp. NPDC088792 TaxID=3364332 RepID=UPI0037F9DE3D